MGKISDLYKKYEEAAEFAEMRVPAKLMLTLTIIGLAASISLAFFIDPTLCLLLALVILDAGIGVPFFFAERKVAQIEERLPDVLHHMGTTLKTGGTIETALKEVSRINYGPITVGLKEMLMHMSEGATFEDAFSSFALKSRSQLLQKAAVIIIAARQSGGALLETLSAMAEDFRAVSRLNSERRTKTFMQFLFIIVAGIIIAPFVFGIVKAVLSILISVGGQSTPETAALVGQFDILFKVYLIVQAALAIIGAVQIREGKMSKAVVYIPIGAIIAYGIYSVLSLAFLSLLGM
ncbi:type II secretion system F family protein [Candidatus Micrarchaeota archaeon]|nr:type II secretion system F family protein [Candidatus Micrarchaeota archaeon]